MVLLALVSIRCGFGQSSGMQNKPELELALKSLSESFNKVLAVMVEEFDRRMRAFEERMPGGGVEPYVTKEQVARHLDVTTRTIENWAREGKLPWVKIGGTARFRLSEVDAHVKRRWETNAASR